MELPVIRMIDGRAYVASNLLCLYLDKRHDNMMRDIRYQLQQRGGPDETLFRRSRYYDLKRRRRRGYYISKHGFELLTNRSKDGKRQPLRRALIALYERHEPPVPKLCNGVQMRELRRIARQLSLAAPIGQRFSVMRAVYALGNITVPAQEQLESTAGERTSEPVTTGNVELDWALDLERALASNGNSNDSHEVVFMP